MESKGDSQQIFFAMMRGFVIMLLLFSIPTYGQGVEKIIFTSQQADEPPTRDGRPKFTIEFDKQSSGDFAASKFYENGAQKRLTSKAVIEKARLDKLISWKQSNKRNFSQAELGLEIDSLRARANTARLNFDFSSELVVDVDSFQFCRDYEGYGKVKSLLNGGEYFTVTLVYQHGEKEEFIFNWSGLVWKNLNLGDFILCYTLLVGRIPDVVPSYGFFSTRSLIDKILYYLKTVECEVFYYKEFVDKNPGMTNTEKRAGKGWNFTEYMKQRNIDK
jgi:hypothetical protein